MDTRALRAFLRVAAIGNMTRAAEALGVSQPSLTRLIRELEQETGFTLFERMRRGVSLTDGGRQFADRVADILHRLDNAVAEINTGEIEPTGYLSVGIPYSLTDQIAIPLVGWFAETYPKSTISLQQGVSHEIEQGLGFGQIDIGILISPRTQVPLVGLRPLAREPLCLFVPRTWVARFESQSVEWKDIAGLPLILPRKQNQLRRRVEEAARNAAIELDVVAEVSAAEATLLLVKEGLGGAILPGSLGSERKWVGTIDRLPIARESVVWTFGRSTHSPATKLSQAVERRILELVANEAQSGRWRALEG